MKLCRNPSSEKRNFGLDDESWDEIVEEYIEETADEISVEDYVSDPECPLYIACEDDEDCFSPPGPCPCWTIDGFFTPGFCTVFCDEVAAVEDGICGCDDGTGMAEGICWSGRCYPSCNVPNGPLGANGCTHSDNMACLDTDLVGTYLSICEGLDMPPGICIPACTDNAWCADFYGSPMTCDEGTGICG